jgi:hypothetical protein
MSDTMIAAAAYLVLTQQKKKKKRRRWWNRELFAQRNLSQETDGQYRENRTRTKLTYKNPDWTKFRQTIDEQLKINRNITDRKQLEHTQ